MESGVVFESDTSNSFAICVRTHFLCYKIWVCNKIPKAGYIIQVTVLEVEKSNSLIHATSAGNFRLHHSMVDSLTVRAHDTERVSHMVRREIWDLGSQVNSLQQPYMSTNPDLKRAISILICKAGPCTYGPAVKQVITIWKLLTNFNIFYN